MVNEYERAPMLSDDGIVTEEDKDLFFAYDLNYAIGSCSSISREHAVENLHSGFNYITAVTNPITRESRSKEEQRSINSLYIDHRTPWAAARLGLEISYHTLR